MGSLRRCRTRLAKSRHEEEALAVPHHRLAMETQRAQAPMEAPARGCAPGSARPSSPPPDQSARRGHAPADSRDRRRALFEPAHELLGQTLVITGEMRGGRGQRDRRLGVRAMLP